MMPAPHHKKKGGPIPKKKAHHGAQRSVCVPACHQREPCEGKAFRSPWSGAGSARSRCLLALRRPLAADKKREESPEAESASADEFSDEQEDEEDYKKGERRGMGSCSKGK